MALALRLARRGVGRTAPNPVVGAVLVKDGKVVGQGYHRAAGEPHAEVEAIRSAGSEARGAELFVTLEPCNHHGRTPPCTDAILEAGIGRVWYGMDDLNPGVRGGGARTLRDAGVEVIGHVIENRCRQINEVYLTNVTLHRPFVFLKLAMSLDGRIATKTGHSRWITCEASRRKVHRLRDRVSAIMVGIGTVIDDDPALTTRLPKGRGQRPHSRCRGLQSENTAGRCNIQSGIRSRSHYSHTERSPPRAQVKPGGARGQSSENKGV